MVKSRTGKKTNTKPVKGPKIAKPGSASVIIREASREIPISQPQEPSHQGLPLKMLIFAALFAALTAAVAPFKIPLPFTPVPITLQTLAVLLSGAMLGPLYGAIAMLLYLIVGALGLPVFAGGSSGIGAILGPTGGYLLSYPVAAFVIGMLMKGKKATRVLAYASFALIVGMVLLVFLDSLLGLGILKLWDAASQSYVPMVGMLSMQQHGLLTAISLIILLALAGFAAFAHRIRMVEGATIFAMFAGTIVIYALGALGGKISTGLPWSAILVGWVLPFILGDTIKLFLAAIVAKTVDISKYLR